jgi:hypothetical protein
MVSAAQRFNIVAAQVESIQALVQRFKNIATQVKSAAQRFILLQPRLKVLQPPIPAQRFKIVATQVVSAAQRFTIVAAQVESVAAPVQRFNSVATNFFLKNAI